MLRMFCLAKSLRLPRLSTVILIVSAMALSSHGADGKRGRKPAEIEKTGPVAAPLFQRFASEDGSADVEPTDEVPSFQKHVSPLFGKLGCNGRACHGSFQGQGGFQLSLFGYDFKADFDALMEESTGRIDTDDPAESLIVSYPMDADAHGGGKRFDEGGWEYWVLRKWIEAGAEYRPAQVQKLERLEVTPAEIQFSAAGQSQQLRVVAHWEDGSREDVTCLSRFYTNDAAIADISADGLVTCGEAGDTHVVVSYDSAVVPVQALRPVVDAATYRVAARDLPPKRSMSTVDRLIATKHKKLGIVPSEICTDVEFLRRASLDVTGTLPSPQEVEEFRRDSSPDKRQRKIEELLKRPGYAVRWTTFFCDMTGNNEDQLRNILPGASPSGQWFQWIKSRVENNVPYDEIVEGIVTAESRRPGETYREYCEAMSEACRDESGDNYAQRPGLTHFWARRNFQTPEDRAIGFAYSFLGVRIQCAQCHKHPFDQWSKDDFDNFEKLFTRVQARQNTVSKDKESNRQYKELLAELDVDSSLKGNQLRAAFSKLLKKGEVVPFPELTIGKPRTRNRGKNKKAQPKETAKLLGGEWVEMDAGDARTHLMQWLRADENPYFAKAFVNRVWAQYFSVGIINPADDVSLANAPSNGPLLEHLSEGFRESGFDMKWVHREILNSAAYQRSWEPNETNAGDKINFSRSLLRRLPAETTMDAIRMAMVNDEYAQRAVQFDVPRAHLVAGSSAKMLARSDDMSYALNVFGRSERESNCDCERSEEPSLLQTVYLLNDKSVHGWLNDRKNGWVGQVAAQYGWPAPTSSFSTGKQRQINQTIDRLELQYERYIEVQGIAQDSGNERRLKQVEANWKRQVAAIRKNAKKAGIGKEVNAWLEEHATTDDEPQVDQVATMNSEQADWIAKNAYLRTLSRDPNEQELATSVAYLLAEENPTDAVAGLLWSLVNTKEFILNH